MTAPAITAVFPTAAAAGTAAHISGSNFTTVTGVTSDGNTVSFSVLDDNNLVTDSYSSLADGTYAFVVTNPDGTDSISADVVTPSGVTATTAWGVG